MTESGPFLDLEGEVKTFVKKEQAEMFMFLEGIEGEVREV